MPAHTTHILQPLDVKVNAPLKRRFSSLATNLGFANPNMTISKGNFAVVVRHALEQTTPLSVREAFRVTGIIPFDPHAIDKSQLIPPTFVRRNEETGGTENTNVRTCESCGSFLVNPLEYQGLIPPSMAQVLIPPCNNQKKTNQKKKSRVVAEGRVISGDEIHKQLKEKEESARKLEEAKEERLKLKEIRKEQKEKDIEERQQKKLKRTEQRELKEKQKEHEKIKKAVGGRLADRKFTCGVCGERGRINDELNGVMWYGCDEIMCEKWYHEECLSTKEKECLRESMEEKTDWFCCKCVYA